MVQMQESYPSPLFWILKWKATFFPSTYQQKMLFVFKDGFVGNILLNVGYFYWFIFLKKNL